MKVISTIFALVSILSYTRSQTCDPPCDNLQKCHCESIFGPVIGCICIYKNLKNEISSEAQLTYLKDKEQESF